MQVKKKERAYMKKKSVLDSLYPSKADGKIPAFKTYQEEALFWDTHSVTDFEDQTEDVEIIFDIEKPRDATLIVRLQKELKMRVKKLAKSKGLDSSGIVRNWIINGLRTEISSSNEGL